ncbi:MAG: hypothetical protein ACOYOF_11975 [Verrucomicrobiaceae bacterium]
MWLCTQLGFFSIVQKESDTFHIRGGCLGDLDTLSSAIGLPSPVASHPGSDYPWRIICNVGDLTRFFALMSASINYGNFKSAIATSPRQHPKLAAYQDIHHRMVEWQHQRDPT